MSGKKNRFDFGTYILMIVLILALALILWDWHAGLDDSVDARIALLEEQMKDKIRPVIQINRATVYNTDGEVVIEDLAPEKREKGKEK